ncbi:plant invertase/pectin methylesterase inhibitor superfamily [Artemisia annua]|uniref:Pectinesterase n=1 Tax=Artemisia annua TaxID=35608 RepID=A0A2U1MXH9_ARTAN|nr:plant invertase/pectin methylesterase inhibitor superfamily [Artemisia annua]
MQTNKHFLLSLSILFLLTFSIFSFLKFTNHPLSLPQTTKPTQTHIHIHKNIQTQTLHTHCQGTLYYDLCLQTLATILPNLKSKTLPDIISATLNQTVTEVRSTDFNVTVIRKKLRNLSDLENRALDDCHTLFVETVNELQSAVKGLKEGKVKTQDDLQTLLSAAMTNQATCLDGFAFSKSRNKIRRYFRKSLRNISRQVSNSLALLKKINGTSTAKTEAFPEYGKMSGPFPQWVGKKERALLQTDTNDIIYNLVVAKDGSGNFATIGEALNAAPNMSTTRFVIYIKAGAYYEYLEIDYNKRMIMLVGDGIGKTLIKGNRSVVDGWTTYRSATVAVVGNNFIAKGITFENYAGPAKHQAVALRATSDFSVFYKCSFVAYQDTLYVHTFRQFFRECDIYGTIDFIFGNAAVVFQKSNLYARQPDLNQKNLFTAQGRDDPNQNTGISLIECKIAAGSELIPNQTMFKSYLGRPWKQYSRTVIMKSYIGDLIDPKGWLEWSGDFALSTLYYGEYLNRGPGSSTSGRVTWPGYKVIMNETEAGLFTVGNFIQGGMWLNDTGVPYYIGLS